MHPLPPGRARLQRIGVSIIAGIVLASGLAIAQTGQQALFVSVTDKAGHPVQGLGPTDFTVREDKATREVVKVGPADAMDIALLVDNSQASEPFQRDMRAALVGFVNAINADTPATGKHHIALITLASRPTIVNDYTADSALLQKNTERIFAMPGTGTYFLDGIIETSTGILKRAPARPVIVAVLTEGPELSDRRYQRVLESLKASGAALYVATIGRHDNPNMDRSVAMDQGSRSTGGRLENVLVSTALPALMKKIADDLTHQYRVTYNRPASLLPPESITVEATKPGLTARGNPVKEVRTRK
jgi:VWFA-related protein